MQLKIPYFSQELNSEDCGVACLLMVLNYYFPDSFDYHKVKERMSFMSTGLTSFSLANFLLTNGLKVEIVYCHPFLFNIANKNQKFSDKELMSHITTASLRKMPPNWTNSLLELVEFIKLGGKLTIDYPKKHHIQKALSQNLPIISLLTTGVLTSRNFEDFATGKGGFFNSHFNVITGLDGETITVNDPEVCETDLAKARKNGGYELGGVQKYNLEDYLYGIYTNTGTDIDNGAMIIASK